MAGTVKKSKTVIHSRRKAVAKPMTKAEMVHKMIADQKIIRDAIQNGTPLKELQKKHGFKFASLPPVKKR